MENHLTLCELFADWVKLPSDCIALPHSLTLDTRNLVAGDVFFGVAGTAQDGKKFIEDAVTKGAIAIVLDTPTDSRYEFTTTAKSIPIIYIHNLQQHLGAIASHFYHHPQRELELIGITGTNGKTSCSHFIANALHSAGHPCGIIGTLGYGLYGQLTPHDHTTPDVFTLYRLLRELRDKGAKSVAMEVSSHSLKQERIQGLHFKVGIFTNLTQDHLDYHGTLENYADCKRLLFQNYPMENAVINLDDAHGKNWLNLDLNAANKFAYTLNDKLGDTLYPIISAQHVSKDLQGLKTGIRSPWGDGVLHTHFLGEFNLYNLLATLTTLGIYNIPLPENLKLLSQLHPVPGRMEKIGGNQQPLVVIDYSHTPDALQKALETLKPYCAGELWCVFGCGGNRDKSKRPLMGNIAEQYADNLIITDDNPRHEDPKEIVQSIMEGLQNQDQVIIEHDRRRAIFHAVSCAQPEDIVLIAGKGHENYQQIGDKKHPFNDNIEAKLALENRIERL